MATSTIAMGVRPPQINALGSNINPFEAMKDVLQMRNMQMQFDANIQGGQVLTTSPNMEAAIETLRRGPYAAYQIPLINQIREGLRTEADINRIRLGTDIDKINFAIKTSTDPQDMASRITSLAGLNNPDLGVHVYESLTHGNPSPEVLEQRKVALLMGAGQTEGQAYGAGGDIQPQVATVQDPFGGPPTTRIVGGVGSGRGGGVVGPPLGGGSDVPTRQQQAQLDRLTDYKAELDKRVQADQGVTTNIGEALNTLHRVETGPLTPILTRVGAVLKQLGMPDEAIKKVTGAKTDLDASDELGKIFNNFILDRSTGLTLPGGRPLLQEYRDVAGSNPSLEMQEKAIRRILLRWQQQIARNRIEQRFLTQYMAANPRNPMSGLQWADRWANELQDRGLLDQDWTGLTPGAEKVSPTDVLKLLANPDRIRDEFDKAYGLGAHRKFIEPQWRLR